VSLAELLLDAVLLSESMCLAFMRVSEDEAGFIEDRHLITILEFPSFVPSNYCLIHKGAVA
jgi:hypothetical protein